MTIAVTGASGELGTLVLEKLKQKVPAGELVALARTPGKVTVQGVAVREADYTLMHTLRPALTGVETLLLISSSEIGQRQAQHANVIEAAMQEGVRRIVYTSLLHADSSPLSLAGEHLATEAALRQSGLAVTVLRNGWYTENYTGSIEGALERGEFLGCAGKGRISSASREDYAEAAVVVLTGTGHDGKAYELAGDQSWTLDDLAAEVSRQYGREIVYRDLPEAEYAAFLLESGLPPPLAAAIANFDAGAAQGALFDESRTLSGLIRRPTTSLASAVTAAGRQEQ